MQVRWTVIELWLGICLEATASGMHLVHRGAISVAPWIISNEIVQSILTEDGEETSNEVSEIEWKHRTSAAMQEQATTRSTFDLNSVSLIIGCGSKSLLLSVVACSSYSDSS